MQRPSRRAPGLEASACLLLSILTACNGVAPQPSEEARAGGSPHHTRPIAAEAIDGRGPIIAVRATLEIPQDHAAPGAVIPVSALAAASLSKLSAAPVATPLPSVHPPSPPTVVANRPPLALPTVNLAQFEANRARAMSHYQNGFALATRGAHFSAREEFVTALKLMAEGLDAGTGATLRAVALAAGLQAIAEMRDFDTSLAGAPSAENLAVIVRSHRTRLFDPDNLAEVTAAAAAQQYGAYAVERMVAGVGGAPESSQILSGLGKLLQAIMESPTNAARDATSEAMIYHQAALAVDPGNYRSANELGVLAARHGHYDVARAWLLHSLQLTRDPTVYQNLSLVHARLGEQDLSLRARQAALAQARGLDPANVELMAVRQAVDWVEPDQFQRRSHTAAYDQPVPANSGPQPAPPRDEPPRGVIRTLRENLSRAFKGNERAAYPSEYAPHSAPPTARAAPLNRGEAAIRSSWQY